MTVPMDRGRSRWLHLVRHAKSSWSNARLADIDRPLNDRGRRAAVDLAGHLAGLRPTPELVLVSPAKRAEETTEPIVAALGGQVVTRVEPLIYEGGPRELLGLLRTLPETTTAVVVVGHNPTLQDLALLLAAESKSQHYARLSEKFPTAAVASLRVPTWRRLEQGSGELTELWMPR